ncbi:MAG: tRNA (adenosine(37)-N6)-threonylcarbamoyltransferase complex ATPase subunit type 1 TsaE [Patescibacteria group bacterium]
MKTYTTKHVQETQELARTIAKQKEQFQVITLQGDLGSGKTTFTQGFAQGLGITQAIISPTFIIIRTYMLPDASKSRKKFLYHVDLYRIEHTDEIEEIGLFDIMQDTQNIVVIEWPEKLGDLLPEKHLALSFHPIDESTREIIVEEKL